VSNVVAGWQRHFRKIGVSKGDVATLAEQIDRPFLKEQRDDYLR
jgi:serine/threonine-protein kinase HipA